MGAAFFTPGEALVDAVAIGLVGHDEDAAVGGSGRDGMQEPAGEGCTGRECWERSHVWHRRGKGLPAEIGPNC